MTRDWPSELRDRERRFRDWHLPRIRAAERRQRRADLRAQIHRLECAAARCLQEPGRSLLEEQLLHARQLLLDDRADRAGIPVLREATNHERRLALRPAAIELAGLPLHRPC